MSRGHPAFSRGGRPGVHRWATIRVRRSRVDENTRVSPYQPRHSVPAIGEGGEPEGQPRGNPREREPAKPEARPGPEQAAKPEAKPGRKPGAKPGPERGEKGARGARTGSNNSIALAGFVIIGVGAALTIAAWPHSAVPTNRQQPASFSMGTSTTSRSSALTGRGHSRAGKGAAPGDRIVTRARHSSASRAAGRNGQPAPTTNPAAAASPADNLAAAPGLGPVLRHAWVAADPGDVGLNPADVRSTLTGSVFYASQPSIGTYWAIAQFVPSSVANAEAGTPAGKALLAQFKQIAIFDKAPGQPWAYVSEFAPGSCPASVPGTVFTAWDLCSVGS